MEKRHSNHKKTKDKSEMSTQSNYVCKNKKGNGKAAVYNVSNSLPVEENVTRSKSQAEKDENHSSKCEIEKHNVLHVMHEPKVYQNSSYESSVQYYHESDDEYACATSDFFKPIFKNHHKNKSFESKNYLDGIAGSKEKIFSSVTQYKNSKYSFSKIYHKWLPQRQETLRKLRSLLKEIHDNVTEYYKIQATFKELSYNSRCFKEITENKTIDFFASLTAFVSDAASGIKSFAQAFEMDSYQSTFQEIMDHDAEITKDLYYSRSQCVLQYQGIEEIIKKFHSSTLASTMDEISDSLQLDKHWAAMKIAYQKNDMTKLLDEVSKFFDNACQSEVLENVGDSVHRYVKDNPAAFEACKSTGRAVYGAIGTFGEKKEDRNSAIRYINAASNLYFKLEDKKEVERLKSIINEDTHQSRLESKIEEAIDSLDAEMIEMNDLYFQLFNIYDD